MKRPFAYIGITSLCAMTVFFCFGYVIAAAVCVCATAVLSAFLIVKRLRGNRQIILICFSLIFSSVFYCAHKALVCDKTVDFYQGKSVAVKAYIIDNPVKRGGFTEYSLETQQIDGKDSKLKLLLLSATDLAAQPYDILECELMLEKNEYAYGISRKFFLCAQAFDGFEYIVYEPENKPFGYHLLTLRSSLSNALDKSLPKLYAGFAKAVALGDRYALDKGIKEQFRTAGLSHIAVVSGLHMSILSGLIIMLNKKLLRNRSKKPAYLAAILFEWFYVILTGCSPSVVRAAVMGTICLLAMIVYDRADSLNSLGAAAFVMLIFNPYYCGDAGFLLSFSATLGIILLSGRIKNFLSQKFPLRKTPQLLKKVLKGIAAVFSVTLSALIFTTPITVLLYGSISLVAILSNVLVVPFIGTAIVSAFGICIFCCIGLAPVASFFALVFSLISKYIFTVVGLITKIPFASVRIDSEYIYLWIFISFLLFVILFAVKKNFKFLKMFLPACALLFVFLSTADIILNLKSVTVEVLPVGTGTTVTVSYGGNKAVLSCGGAQSKAHSAINAISKGTDKISLLAVTDSSEKSSRYAIDILNEFDVSQLLVYDNEKVAQSCGYYYGKANNVDSFSQKCLVTLSEKVKADFIAVNESVFIYLKTEKLTMLILPPNGDCCKLPPQYTTADVIIANTAIKNDSLLQCDTLILSCTEQVSDSILRKTQIKRSTTSVVKDEAIAIVCRQLF